MVLILVLGLLGISFGAPLARFLPLLPALAIAFWRMAGSSAVLWASASIQAQESLTAKQQMIIGLAGSFLALHFLCFYAAVKTTTIANATLFATLAPLFTLMFERLVLKRHLPWKALLGFWLAILGVVWVQGTSVSLSVNHTQGNLYALASSLFMAVVLILAERIRSQLTNILYTRWLYFYAALALGVVALIQGIPLIPGPNDWLWLLALVLLPTLMGHNSMSYAVKYLRPSVVGAMPFGEPILASLWAWLLFEETVPTSLILGGALTLAGLFMLTRYHRESQQS